MKRDLRLRKSTDFRRVRRIGKSYVHPLMVLVALQNGTEHTRIGVAAGKSIGNAVARNRAKRLLRAAAVSHYQRIHPGWDLILIARAPMAKSKLNEILPALLTLLQRAHLLSGDRMQDNARR